MMVRLPPKAPASVGLKKKASPPGPPPRSSPTSPACPHHPAGPWGVGPRRSLEPSPARQPRDRPPAPGDRLPSHRGAPTDCHRHHQPAHRSEARGRALQTPRFPPGKLSPLDCRHADFQPAASLGPRQGWPDQGAGLAEGCVADAATAQAAVQHRRVNKPSGLNRNPQPERLANFRALFPTPLGVPQSGALALAPLLLANRQMRKGASKVGRQSGNRSISMH